MNTLDHIESHFTEYAKYKEDLFITITLPKRYNRMGAKRQYEVMNSMIKQIGSNLFESFIGCMELTTKGNIHVHVVAKPLVYFPNIKFDNRLAESKANITYIYNILKQYSISDVQCIKNIENVYKYIHKDNEVTTKILDKKPYVRYYTRHETKFMQEMCDNEIIRLSKQNKYL